MSKQLSKWELAVEYGTHLFGIFPSGSKQMVTGVLHHEGNVFESYVDSGAWRQYPNWIREYENTPLADALEQFVAGEEMHTIEVVFENCYHEQQPLESAGMGSWRFEYEDKMTFRREVLRGNIDLGTTAIVNRYGSFYCPPEDAEDIREAYWEFVN